MAKKRQRDPRIEIPPKVYLIAERRAKLCLRTAMRVSDLTIEQLVIGAYLQGVEDMGLAVAKYGNVRPAGPVSEFEVM